MRQNSEHERKWIVLSVDPDIRRSESVLIHQAYFGLFEGLRVRITEDERGNRSAEITDKTGHGVSRTERNVEVNLEAAEFLFWSSPYRIQKRRYRRDGWEIDFYDGQLVGLVTAEFEAASPDELLSITLPPWIPSSIEVTDAVTNAHLARMAADLSCGGDGRPVRDRVLADRPRIVLTGGPCSGKSTAIDRLKTELSDFLQCVPETATIIIGRVSAKPPIGDAVAACRFQRTVYRVQCGFEEVSLSYALREGKTALLLDRGTADNAAYVSGGMDEFENVCMTTAETEYARYAAVIMLDVPSREVYERTKGNNPARGESYEEACALGERIAKVWSGHPNLIRIGVFGTFEEKYAAIRAAVERILKRN